MPNMNIDGTIIAGQTYTENQLRLILDISQDQMLEHYKAGLRFFQRTRSQRRLITGDEWHRYTERNLQEWPRDESDEGA